jgi:hypothetical protein
MTAGANATLARRAAALTVLAILVSFYWVAASTHARRINTSRVRADQSGYLWDAVGIYRMRHGAPAALIGERNRMPIYPWLLSWLYDPAYSPDAFFEVGKRWNIALSLVLLAAIAVLLRQYLPPLPAANLTLVVAFGYFVFKAGYAQVELLFYTSWFVTFLACARVLADAPPRESAARGAAAGVLAAVSHLLKASLLPLAAIVVAVCAGRLAAGRAIASRTLALAAFIACFLGVLSPYLVNSKRAFGHYFYNVNTTFYAWYDDWPAASVGTYRHGDGVGWPTMPRDQIPGMRKYLREHSVAQIAGRIGDGLLEMVTVSYTRLGHFKYVVLYGLFAGALVVSNRAAFARLVRGRPALSIFLLLYAAVYLLAVAFYKPISGTTLRMQLTHVLPLLFVLSCLMVRRPFSETTWRVGGATLTPAHGHVGVSIAIGFDLVFTLWPRLMGEFAGY